MRECLRELARESLPGRVCRQWAWRYSDDAERARETGAAPVQSGDERPARLHTVSGEVDAVGLSGRDPAGKPAQSNRVNPCPESLDDRAAERAEFGDETGNDRPPGRVVLPDRDDPTPAEPAVGVAADAGRPLGRVDREAEDIWCRLLERRRLFGARKQESDDGMRLRVRAEGDNVTRKRRPDDHARALAFDQAAQLGKQRPTISPTLAADEQLHDVAGHRGS